MHDAGFIGIYGILGLLMGIVQPLVYVVGLYFLISAIRYLNKKQQTDEILMKKINYLIQLKENENKPKE